MATFATAYMATYNATAYMADQFRLSLLAAHHIEISCWGYSYWQSKLFIIKKIKRSITQDTPTPILLCWDVFWFFFWILNLWKWSPGNLIWLLSWIWGKPQDWLEEQVRSSDGSLSTLGWAGSAEVGQQVPCSSEITWGFLFILESDLNIKGESGLFMEKKSTCRFPGFT